MDNGIVKLNFVGKEILCSGSITIINDEVEFKIADLVYILRFLKDEESKDARAENTLVEGNRMTLVFYNFDNLLGLGFVQPWKLGLINNKSLMLNFIIYGWHENCRTMHYTWYLDGGNGPEKKQPKE